MERMRTTASRVAGQVAASWRMTGDNDPAVVASWRVLVLTLAIIVAGAIAPDHAAAEIRDGYSPFELKVICAEVGVYWEYYDEYGNLVGYGCDFDNGDEMTCWVGQTPLCTTVHAYPVPVGQTGTSLGGDTMYAADVESSASTSYGGDTRYVMDDQRR